MAESVTVEKAIERKVATWGYNVRNATEKRNYAIRAAHAEGISLRRIAALAGLSHTAVANIVGAS